MDSFMPQISPRFIVCAKGAIVLYYICLVNNAVLIPSRWGSISTFWISIKNNVFSELMLDFRLRVFFLLFLGIGQFLWKPRRYLHCHLHLIHSWENCVANTVHTPRIIFPLTLQNWFSLMQRCLDTTHTKFFHLDYFLCIWVSSR